jgi:hypothetical protein
MREALTNSRVFFLFFLNIKKTSNVVADYCYYIVPAEVLRSAIVETLRYKSEGHGFDSRWSHFNFK